MARLLSWPEGLKWTTWKPLNGPQSVGAAANTTIGNVTQTAASPFGARHLQFFFPPLQGQMARRARGLVTKLQMGANAVRVALDDPDGMSPAEAGLVASQQALRNGLPWSNGEGWSNGQNWAVTKPLERVAAAAAFDDSIIRLRDDYWGYGLGDGDWFGFAPSHFGLYEVTETFGDGRYRIWPPLRKALKSSDYATLRPTMAMRLLSTNLPDMQRGVSFLEGLTISLFEVFDYDVKDYFTE